MEALMAFRRGEDSYSADAGAFLIAEAFADLRALVQALTARRR